MMNESTITNLGKGNNWLPNDCHISIDHGELGEEELMYDLLYTG